MTDAERQLIVLMVTSHFTGLGLTPTSDELKEQIRSFAKLYKFSLTRNEEKLVYNDYRKNNAIKKEPDNMIVLDKDDGKWFKKLTKNGTSQLKQWCRYKKYLTREGFPKQTIDEMERSALKTVSHLANPNAQEKKNKSRKGLVVGDVQSGKTANYLGLMNMAVDAGYKTIVLLTGTSEDLRIQTQIRVDEGFIGAKSDSYSKGDPVRVGISDDGEYYAIPFTTTEHDFNANTTRSIPKNSDLNKPGVYIIKKNARILDNLRQFADSDRDHSLPLLIIDDECDNASVNTAAQQITPTRINSEIRKLFDAFNVVSYVGYSATPFANIFIDPDATWSDPNGSGGENIDDLFPSDFIVLLNPSNDYFGPRALFSDKDPDQPSSHVILLNPMEPGLLKSKHKKEDVPYDTWESLEDAIMVFLLGNCVRTLRGYGKKHRSMMINVSRFNRVQEAIKTIVDDFLNDLKNEVRSSYALPLEDFCGFRLMKRLYDLWNDPRYFSLPNEDDVDDDRPAKERYSFEEVKQLLDEEIQKFETAIVYGRNKKGDRFDYSKRDEGARVIIIGGFALSRGLTLEGLMVSYYNRNASAFDVLMQMGRWFGYRHFYKDLVYVYMTRSNLDQYGAVLESVDDLKLQFKELESDETATPRDFGLMIREAPDSLDSRIAITARNKSRSTETHVFDISLSGQVIDTSKILKSPSSVRTNKNAIMDLINDLRSRSYKIINSTEVSPKKKNRKMFMNVPSSFVTSFLAKLDLAPVNSTFDKKTLIDFIDKTPEIEGWTIVCADGNSKEKLNIDDEFFEGIVLNERSFVYQGDESFLRISGQKNRLSQPGLFNCDLDKAALDEVNAKVDDEVRRGLRNSFSKSSRDYMSAHKKTGILAIYPLRLKNEDSDPELQKIIDSLNGECVWGFALGFPGSFGTKKTIYRLNKVKIDEIAKANAQDEDDEEEEE